MKKFIAGLCLGIGAGIAGRELAPAVRRIGKPFAKAAIRGGIQALEKGIEVASHLGETLEDIVAEVRSEMDRSTPQQSQQNDTASKAPRSRKKKNAPTNVAKSHNQPSDQQPPPSSHTS
jgi:cell pole-organizing protein PopZ